MTEHLSVDYSVSPGLGCTEVAILLPSFDQTLPANKYRGLEKFFFHLL